MCKSEAVSSDQAIIVESGAKRKLVLNTLFYLSSFNGRDDERKELIEGSGEIGGKSDGLQIVKQRMREG